MKKICVYKELGKWIEFLENKVPSHQNKKDGFDGTSWTRVKNGLKVIRKVSSAHKYTMELDMQKRMAKTANTQYVVMACLC